MNAVEAWTFVRQWVPFGLRTVGYGCVSVFIGPFTREHSASLWAMRQWCISSARGLEIGIEASGAEHVPESGRFVYCSNHQSLVDILILGAVLPGDYKWAAKRSLMKIPFLGWHLRLAGHVPVDRGAGGKAAEDVIDRFTSVLRKDKPLLIFPEGTRTLDGTIKDFKPGAFKAAIRGNAPIIPVALDGTFDMMSKGDRRAAEDRTVVRVKIGEPIEVPEGTDEAERVTAMMQATREAMTRLFEDVRAKPPADSAE